ncbi:hypothetical protein QCA50_006967 [Cerrena zonata]|uniref:Urea carboxylase n=1 Tax=Cerrena zonata TaxID=2478898 RepID=A0AAW0GMF8_9APHY
MDSIPPLFLHKLLVANRGEIAVRILKTAKRLGILTVAVYTQVDATSPHVSLADEAFALKTPTDTSDNAEYNAARAYADAEDILDVCLKRGVTLVHPGYGFLSENAHFAKLLDARSITLLGPSVKTIEDMGLKHRARVLAVEAGVPVVPGSDGLVTSLAEAEDVATTIGFPVILKATTGGGGMGLVVCRNVEDLHAKFESIRQRAKSLFHDDGVFMEKFFDVSRHIEVQIFGDGCGNVIHMGERECSVQRRHQKIIEESPSPYLVQREGLREQICSAAVQLGKLINYKSAGTVEFIVDDASGNFYFLEMNTRLQVEHGVTEMLHPGLDIVELMILQGVYERASKISRVPVGLPEDKLDQDKYAHPTPNSHSIEIRVYSENPANNFTPSPGVLQLVQFPDSADGVRIDTWVETGTSISPYYDPLIAKVIVKKETREEAIRYLLALLEPQPKDTGSQALIVQGPPNNLEFLTQVLRSQTFGVGRATTEWIDSGGLAYTPNAMTIVSPGLSTSVQSLPVRDIGLGIPPSGPMDPLALQAANCLVGNPFECEGLELVIPPKNAGRTSGLSLNAIFHIRAVVAVTGADAGVQVNGEDVATWSRIVVPPGGKLTIGSLRGDGSGFRAYLAVLGGFPGVPVYLGSKSTSMGSGGYQGRNLQAGDFLQILPVSDAQSNLPSIPNTLIPEYPTEWTLYSLSGPHDDTEYLTDVGIEAFYTRMWKVSTASNRMGIRLEPILEGDASDTPILQWARQNGGEGGSHPSNILDNGYARGSVNLNGDTPVILTKEGPSMGGYVCVSTLASADQWKLGQLRPGHRLQFKRIAYNDAMKLQEHTNKWLETVLALSSGFNASPVGLLSFNPSDDNFSRDPKLHTIPAIDLKPKVVFRQAGDSAILVEYGDMTLDFAVRARIHGLETALRKLELAGIKELAPCIRSTMVHYDPQQISQAEVLSSLICIEESLPDSVTDMEFPGRKLTFPIVLDDKWNTEALVKYMRSIRDQAVYLPSNAEYLARNNGVEGGKEEALRLLVSSPWLVFGVGFYLACPFLVPVDPRCRLVGQKMNPSRTYTPRGAVGIAGLVAAIYPVESPGGYQLFGRTLPTWQPWGKGPNFAPDKPWVLKPFDQVVFNPVPEAAYHYLEHDFDSGEYEFKELIPCCLLHTYDDADFNYQIEDVIFSMKEYLEFVSSIQDEVSNFKERQVKGVASEEAHEQVLLKKWQTSQHKDHGPSTSEGTMPETANFVCASLAGTVWKVNIAVDDIVTSADQVIVILEAMKTEIPITAGEENVGLKVSGIVKSEGTTVEAGDKLIFFSEN